MRNNTRQYQYYDEQNEAIEKRPIFREGPDKLWNGGQHRSADERSDDHPAPTNDDGHEEIDAEIDDEGIGRDVALLGRVKSS